MRKMKTADDADDDYDEANNDDDADDDNDDDNAYFLYSDEETLQLSKGSWRLYLVSTKHLPLSFFNS